jgi:FAD/FMN-containing dehydrogenase
MAVANAALSSLRASFASEIVLPGDPEYEAARAVWNGMADRRPAVVLRATNAADVATAIRFAREQDLTIAVRSGGHSIPGLSTCDEGAVIDLSRMRGADVDAGGRLARVNGGALLSELDDAAQAVGLVCPVGVVSHTGVAGLTLGGGMGRLQRKLGLTIDSLQAVEVVTAEGEHVRASDDENSDLFWGLRGAGANFGIATSFEFRLHELDHPITHGSVVHPIERAAELTALYRETLETGPDELWLSFALARATPVEDYPPEVAGRPAAFVTVTHCGPSDAAERDVAALRAFGPPAADSIEAKPYLTAQRLNDEAMEWGHRFYMKSAFLPGLPDEVVDAAAKRLDSAPEGADAEVSVWSWGRAIASVPEEATAFTGRDAAVWFSAEILWDDDVLDDDCRDWGRAVLDDVAPFATTGRYVNDVAERFDDAAMEVYGAAKAERLTALKRTWDPDNVFRLNQNIRP